MPFTLSDSDEAAETAIAKAVLALLRGGSFTDRGGSTASTSYFAGKYRPMLLIESPTEKRLFNFSAGTLAVIPGVAQQQGAPSDRVTLKVPVFIVLYLPFENTASDSACLASNECGRLRRLLWSAQELKKAGDSITFATLEFAWVDARVNGGVLICTYRALFTTDIEPTTGEFI